MSTPESRTVALLAWLGLFCPVLLPATLVWSLKLDARQESGAFVLSVLGLIGWGIAAGVWLWRLVVAYQYTSQGVSPP